MAMFVNISGMSLGGLKAMQRAIHDRLIEEDKQPPGQAKVYDVRGFADWKEQADEIEAELDRRSVVYIKVLW